MYFIMLIGSLVRNNFDSILEEIRFEKALEQQLTKQGMIQISPTGLS